MSRRRPATARSGGAGRRPAPGGCGLTLRPITEADRPFLARLYASTRADELAAVDWPQAEKDRFLAEQFRAQHAHYTAHYPEAAFDLLEKDGAAVGRLYLAWWARELRVIDIALLPEWRGRGLGSALMRGLIEAAAAAGKAVTIHVEKFNPALGLYRRLGFREVEDKGVYLLLEYPAPAGAAAAAYPIHSRK